MEQLLYAVYDVLQQMGDITKKIPDSLSYTKNHYSFMCDI